jgi:hypothetical protein
VELAEDLAEALEVAERAKANGAGAGGGGGESSGARGEGDAEGPGSTGSRLGALSDFASPPGTCAGDSDEDDEAYGGQATTMALLSRRNSRNSNNGARAEAEEEEEDEEEHDLDETTDADLSLDELRDLVSTHAGVEGKVGTQSLVDKDHDRQDVLYDPFASV